MTWLTLWAKILFQNIKWSLVTQNYVEAVTWAKTMMADNLIPYVVTLIGTSKRYSLYSIQDNSVASYTCSLKHLFLFLPSTCHIFLLIAVFISGTCVTETLKIAAAVHFFSCQWVQLDRPPLTVIWMYFQSSYCPSHILQVGCALVSLHVMPYQSRKYYINFFWAGELSEERQSMSQEPMGCFMAKSTYMQSVKKVSIWSTIP